MNIYLLLLLLFFFQYVHSISAVGSPINIWPKPRIFTWTTPQAIPFSPSFTISAPSHPYLTPAVNRYLRQIQAANYNPLVVPAINVTVSLPLQTLTITVSDLQATLSHGVNESYTLTVPSNNTSATLTAATPWGAMRGLESFSQLVWGNPAVVAAGLVISDWPMFEHRGILLDTSRNYYGVEDLLRLIGAMSANKLNVFHWHITDSQSFPLVLKSEPELAGKGSYGPSMQYSTEDVKRIVEFGLEHGVRVIPEIDMPGCGDMAEARKVFDEMPEKDVVSWSIMIDGYGKKTGDVNRARSLFDQMHKRDLVSWNTMIDLYAKVGDMVAARELFDEMEHKNVISWSIMIDGYSQHRDPKEALNVFNLMLSNDIKPDKFCVVGAILACAQLGALDQGKWIHIYIRKNGITLDMVVNTALVDMYMKCGSTQEARAVFVSMSERTVISWNVMISGLGINGFGDEALSYFNQMGKEGIQADNLIYVSILSACSHAGFVSKGLEIFRKIPKPKVEHYGCLIDLLGRAGKLGQALGLIASMPMEANSDLWGSILLACQVQKNVGVGELVLNKLKKLDGDDCGVYVVMSNIYAENGMWEYVTKMRKMVSERGMRKESGKSVIEVVDGGVQEFVCGKKGRVHGHDIQQLVWSLSKIMELD